MRKSTTIAMGILLTGFAVLFFAAETALRPLAEDAEVSREITRDLANRTLIVPDTKVRVLRVPGAPKRMAPDGRGVLVHLAPRTDGKRRAGGLGRLAGEVADRVFDLYGPGRLDWVEIVFEIGDERRPTLVRLGEDGDRLAPTPSPDA